jgi:hypothetical protein
MAEARSQLPRGDRSALPSLPLFALNLLFISFSGMKEAVAREKKGHYEGRGVNTASRHHIFDPFSIE